MSLGLLLDVDGTLMDTFEDILTSMNLALAEVSVIPPLRDDELRPLIGRPVAYQMGALRGTPENLAAEINDRYYRHFTAIVRERVRLYPGVEQTLEALAGRRIGTFTTRRKEVAQLMFRVAGIERHFTAITGGDEVSRPKPNPDLALHAAKAVGVAPGMAVIVGDAPVDIQAGKAAGTWTVAAIYGYGGAGPLRGAGPDMEISRFAELPQVLEELDRRGPYQ